MTRADLELLIRRVVKLQGLEHSVLNILRRMKPEAPWNKVIQVVDGWAVASDGTRALRIRTTAAEGFYDYRGRRTCSPKLYWPDEILKCCKFRMPRSLVVRTQAYRFAASVAAPAVEIARSLRAILMRGAVDRWIRVSLGPAETRVDRQILVNPALFSLIPKACWEVSLYAPRTYRDPLLLRWNEAGLDVESVVMELTNGRRP